MLCLRKSFAAFLPVPCLALLTTGCNLSQFSATSTAATPMAKIAGNIHGGNQPVSGAVIQLYAANTTTLKGASTALLTTAVLSDSGGNFTITGDYTCPTPTTLVYLVATGGNPGLSGTVNNTGIALMTVLGTCGSLSSSTFITLNELTTVAAVETLAPFMADFAHIGSSSSNAIGLTGAFSSAAALVDFSTGKLTAAPAGVTTPSLLIDTLADIISTCINTSGGAAGDGTACGKLFLYTTVGSNVPTDTGASLLSVVQNPTNNTASLYALAPSSPPFQPVLADAPASFAAASTSALPGGSNFYAIAIDTAQHVWIYTLPIGGLASGELQIFDNNGSLLHSIPDGSGGLSQAMQIEPDPFGNVWALNSSGSLSKFGPDGTALSPVTGFATASTDSGNAGYVTKMAIDSSGNVWKAGITPNFGVTNCYTESSNAGVLITPAGAYCPIESSSGMLSQTIALDPSGNVYFSGLYLLFNPSTAYVFKVSGTGQQISPLPGYFGGSFTTGTTVLRYDPVYNQLWGWDIVNGNGTLEAMASDGTMLSPAIGGFPLPPAVASIQGVTLDGAGNMWYSLQFGANGTINAIDHLGNPITPTSIPYSPGIQVTGMVGNSSMAVDAYGNLWVTDIGTHLLNKISGLAVPKIHQ